MRKKKLSVIMFMFLASLVTVSMPAPPAKAASPVKFTVGTGEPIACKPVGQVVSVSVYVDDTLNWQGSDGMVQWGFDVITDPTVLEPKQAVGAIAGYYMYEFLDWKCTSEQTACDPDLSVDHTICTYPSIWGGTPSDEEKASGNWSDISEVIMPTPAFGAGHTGAPTTEYYYDEETGEESCIAFTLPRKLVTLSFTSKSITAGTWIKLRRAAYRSADRVWHDLTVENGGVVDSRYCVAPEFPSGVEAAAAIGLMAAIAYVWLRKRKTEPTVAKRFITPTSQ